MFYCKLGLKFDLLLPFISLRFDIESNGLVSAAPFICQTVLTFFCGWFADYVRSKNWLRTVTVRRINNAIGLILPGITVVLAGYAGCNAGLAIFLFTTSVGFTAFTIPGAKSRQISFRLILYLSKYHFFTV